MIERPTGEYIFLYLDLYILKQLENNISIIPISKPRQVNIDQTSISDHLINRVSGDKINAPIDAIPIPLNRLPDIEKFKIIPKYKYYLFL
jgi:hypothetical protein|tara:strand:- start:2318 stop:2587 length:270 start_codon:yes stop_codon:yes gene_type:complete